MLKALRHPPLARLWCGQALSSIGDEIYRVGLTWLAVGLIGADTGYLTAAQFAALMLLSLIGGKWADNWDPLPTMMTVDLARGFVVLIPVAWSFFSPVPLSLLVVVALIISALSAFFDPALQAALPRFAPNVQILRAATGLMSTTIRLARMIGPGLVGVLSGIIPPIHFFTVNAASFFLSATFVRSLRKYDSQHPTELGREKTRTTFREAILAAFKCIRTHSGMSFVLYSKTLTGGVWNLAFVLGYALLAQEIAPNDVSSFGLLVGAYGSGNIAGALFFGNRDRKRPLQLMYLGHLWIGLGFALVALVPNYHWMILCASFTGAGGPTTELGFLDILQSRLPARDITKVFRLRMALETGSALILMLASPFLFRQFGTRSVIVGCGIATIATGLLGFMNIRFGKKHDA